MLRIVAVILALLAASCALPRDPEKTSQRIASTHELRVGVSDNPPWTIVRPGTPPSGIEPTLIRRFASSQGAHVTWFGGGETPLVEKLEDGQLDVVAGGFDKQTQWKTKAGVTQPFAETPDKKMH